MKNEYQIFPDIRLICGDIPETSRRDVLEIGCCIKGICECCTDMGISYPARGDCFVLKHGKNEKSSVTGSANCRVISLLVDMRISNEGLSELIGTPDNLLDISENEVCVCHNEKITEAFSVIYRECMNEQAVMLKVRVLELLILLNEQKIKTHRKNEKIRKAGRFICEHISEHYTISQLSEMFGIDGTTLKNLFRQIHGCPVYTYAKNRKMFRAAELLKTTDMKVIDVAEEVGYSNASKFSSAFRDVMGVNPKYFQMEHKSSRRISNSGILPQITY